MLKNYFKIAFNQVLNHKLYSAINILGLAVGLACFVLITLFVLDELSYDKQYKNADRIYRISRDYFPAEFRPTARYPASINAPFGPQLKQEFSQIEEMARLFSMQVPISQENTSFLENNISFVDPSFLDIFQFEWLQGNPENSLAQPYSIILTETLAKKYFGTENPLGQSLTFSVGIDFEMQVTGVIGDLPENTHLAVSALVSLSTVTNQFTEHFLQSWEGNTDFHTYLRLQEDAEISELTSQFPDFIDRHVGENQSASSGITAMKLTDIHLHSTRVEELKPVGKIINIYSFAFIAFCIVLIACINFMNLSTSRSTQRAKEVGMRKAIGADSSQLVKQFLGESIFFSGLAMIAAIVLIELLLPAFSTFVDKDLSFSYIQEIPILLGLVVLALSIGLIAGIYPAFFLSAFKPAHVLKGDLAQGKSGLGFRQCLVVLQFSISITLVIATAVVYTQMKYARSIDLGLDKEQLVIMSRSGREGLSSQWPNFKNALLNYPDISNVSSSAYTPFMHDDNSLGIIQEGSSKAQMIKYNSVDYNFFETYGIDLLAGRVFSEARVIDQVALPSEQYPQGGGSFIINETAAKLFGWTAEEASNQIVNLEAGGGLLFPIIGVVQDSYFESLTTAVKPMVFLVPPKTNLRLLPLREAAIRVREENLSQTLAFIDRQWNEFYPNVPLSRHFLNDDFDALYKAEQQQGEMLRYFAILAISIACLGLFGLATFNAERRTKEIGVRKVMGGSVWSIVVLLTNDFSKLVLISNLIAWPVAYIVMERWLENFAYRIDLTPLIFIGSGMIALCIAWVTVGGTAAKAASQKPVLALRYE